MTDALSQTLRVVRLVGAIFLHGRFTAPWCYQSPHADTAAPFLEPTAERVVIFHLITEGECWVELVFCVAALSMRGIERMRPCV